MAFIAGAIICGLLLIIHIIIANYDMAVHNFCLGLVYAMAATVIKQLSNENEEMSDMFTWRDPNVELPDPDKYDWVLIKVQYSDGFIGIPQIGEFRSDGYWHSESYDDIVKFGESFEIMCGCKVIGWKPIE